MKVQIVKIDKIIPYINNPRKNQNVDKVANSIKEFGFRQPLVVDKDYNIIVGHTRFQAAKQIGLKEVPIHIANLNKDQLKAYRIADNRVNQESEWDYKLLHNELKDLIGEDYNMFTLGFEGLELENIINADSFSTKWLDQMKEWKNMPEFKHDDKTPYKRLVVNFETKKDVDAFFKLIKQEYTDKTQYINIPKRKQQILRDKGYVSK
jgi:hypothetical protein|tara:strand:+ start:474 stop:1094 length:621 start_codon:yes stop_codon:yes gene_type:complete